MSNTISSTVKTGMTIAAYVFGVAAGVTAIVVGATRSEPGFIVIGVAFLLAVAVAFIAGAAAKPKASLPPNIKYGGVFTPPDWAWYIAAPIVVVGIVVGAIMLAA